MADVVNHVSPDPKYQSDGGKFASECEARVILVAVGLTAVAILSMLYFNTTKLMM